MPNEYALGIAGPLGFRPSHRGVSANAQNEVLSAIGLVGVGQLSHSDDARIPAKLLDSSDDGTGPVELTVALVRKLTANLSDKTLNALKLIAQSDSPQFHMKDVIANTQGAKTYMDLRGVWSALTRRTRKIMDDADVELVWWTGEWIEDSDGNYVDHIGTVSPMTHNSLRTHFKL